MSKKEKILIKRNLLFTYQTFTIALSSGISDSVASETDQIRPSLPFLPPLYPSVLFFASF